MVAASLRNIVWVVVLTAYILGGATFFHLTEAPLEIQRQQEAALNLETLLRNMTRVTTETLHEFRRLTDALAGAEFSWTNDTIKVTKYQKLWDFHQALFFCMTVVTTIGYGNTTPTTQGTRTFCVFYALFGIPLFLILLSYVGQRVARFNNYIAMFACRTTRSRHIEKVVRVAVVGVVLFLFLPSISFMYTDGWSYDISLYYSFITLSTIGFGDYVPGGSSYPLVKVMFALWIIFGLSWFSTLIVTIQDAMTKTPDETPVETGNKISSSGKGDQDERVPEKCPPKGELVSTYL